MITLLHNFLYILKMHLLWHPQYYLRHKYFRTCSSKTRSTMTCLRHGFAREQFYRKSLKYVVTQPMYESTNPRCLKCPITTIHGDRWTDRQQSLREQSFIWSLGTEPRESFLKKSWKSYRLQNKEVLNSTVFHVYYFWTSD